MTWITPFEANMNISRNVYEGRPDNRLVAVIQKIALCLIIPFAFIVFFEAIVKNLILVNLANLGITLLNAAHDLYAKMPKLIPLAL
jgi:hypothetical protein